MNLIYSGANLCTGGTHLLDATCDSSGFVIKVDETCRDASYSWINFGSGSFVWGVSTVETIAEALTAANVADTAALKVCIELYLNIFD